MLKEKYLKFKKAVKDHNLIPDGFNKIYIAMSGGKDIGTLSTLLLEYQKHERPDLQLEMLQVPFPDWLYYPEKCFNDISNKELLEKQKLYLEQAESYWTSKGFPYLKIPVQKELYTQRIQTSHWPCIWCLTAKTKALLSFLREQGDDNSLLAFGWTKWDIIFALISHFLKSDGTRWEVLKEENPDKFSADCRFLASFSPYQKLNLGIPNKNILRIQPLLDFNDVETNAVAKRLCFPIIPDICKDLYGSNFEQDRRNLSMYIKIMTTNQSRLKTPDSAFLFNVHNMINYFQKIGILPPFEELDGKLYAAYQTDFDVVYDLLKYDEN